MIKVMNFLSDPMTVQAILHEAGVCKYKLTQPSLKQINVQLPWSGIGEKTLIVCVTCNKIYCLEKCGDACTL